VVWFRLCHGSDKRDFESMKKCGMDDTLHQTMCFMKMGSMKCDVNYIQQECENLAAQLGAISSKSGIWIPDPPLLRSSLIYTLLILAIIGILVSSVLFFIDKLLLCKFIFIFVLFSFFVSVFGPLFLGDLNGEKIIDKEDIYSVRDEKGVMGSFLLGTGSIGSIKKYVCFVNTDNGFIHRTYPIYNTYIKEDGGNKPYAESHWETTSDWVEDWVPTAWVLPMKYKHKQHTILHVPKGTLILQFGKIK